MTPTRPPLSAAGLIEITTDRTVTPASVLSREFAEHRERRRAPAARRDDREYREYLREEQRRSRGAAAPVGRPRRMPVNFRDRALVLLCHKLSESIGFAQHGQRSRRRTIARPNRYRSVAMELGTWRCILPAASRFVAFG
jgi:hypothetical protein